MASRLVDKRQCFIAFLRLCVFALKASEFNAKSQRRQGASFASRHFPRSAAVSRERDQPQRQLPDEKAGIDPGPRNDSTAAAGAPRTQPRSVRFAIGAVPGSMRFKNLCQKYFSCRSVKVTLWGVGLTRLYFAPFAPLLFKGSGKIRRVRIHPEIQRPACFPAFWRSAAARASMTNTKAMKHGGGHSDCQ